MIDRRVAEVSFSGRKRLAQNSLGFEVPPYRYTPYTPGCRSLSSRPVGKQFMREMFQKTDALCKPSVPLLASLPGRL